MKLFLAAALAASTGSCFDMPDININCTGGGNTILCSWFGDAGTPVADSGIDAAIPDAGQAVDSSIPTVDSSSPKDSGPVVVDAGPVVVDAGQPTATNRPAASKGTGLFVVGSKVYDGNGKPFTFRGTSKTHQDNLSPGLGKTKSNATRWIVYFTEDPDRTLRDMQGPAIGGSILNGRAVQIPGFWDGTCKSDAGTFNTMVNRWVRDAAKYQTMERNLVLNVANEWGDDPVAWRDAYVAALPRIRAAGFHGLVMVDAPGCGQNGAAIVPHGAAILAADPEHNVVFSWHGYGNVYDSGTGGTKQWKEQIDLVPTMDALKASGLAVVIGEFGPGHGLGEAQITAQRWVDQAEAHGFGWLSWSWDDNDGPNGTSSNNSFSHSYSGDYNSPADLTDFGKVIVGNWDRLAVKASTL